MLTATTNKGMHWAVVAGLLLAGWLSLVGATLVTIEDMTITDEGNAWVDMTDAPCGALETEPS